MKPGARASDESPGAAFRLVDPLNVSVETKIKIWRSNTFHDCFVIVVVIVVVVIIVVIVVIMDPLNASVETKIDERPKK